MRYFPFLFAVLLFACSTPADPQHALLDQFVDAYIHHADHVAAQQFAAGDALAKLQGEAAGVAGQERPTTFPDVTFTVVDERTSADSVTFELQLIIKSADVEAFTRDLMITGARVSGEWKVVEFVFLR